MKCPYCAEEIQDNAIVCRYCHAVKEQGGWQAPTHASTTNNSGLGGIKFTARTAAIFFMASGLIGLLSISAPVVLFGSEYRGVVPVLYHLFFILLYLGMGIGLWIAKPWGLHLMLAGSVTYTLDKIHYLIYGDETSRMLDEYGAILGPDGEGMISGIVNISTFITLAAWWGFMAYLYYHRSYFQPGSK